MAASARSGGCHCGAVRFEADLPDAFDIEDCNCSICAMSGNTHVIVPASRFRLLKGADNLTEYTFNSGQARHLFCKTCGVQPFGRGSTPDGREMVAVNVRTLTDVEPWSLQAQRVDGASF